MDIVEYIKLLVTCDVGINNSDRQHGMANINMLLGTGVKFYMRIDISMWNTYKGRVFIFDDVKNINTYNFEQFVVFDTKLRKRY